MEQLQKEVEEKVQKNQAQVVLWDIIRKIHPKKLKTSRIAMISHKSCKYRAILDLSYMIQMKDQIIKSINETTKAAQQGAMDQMGHVLDRSIHTYAKADDDKVIFAVKEDTKDSFWRCAAEERKEWNFAYVLPQAEGQPVKFIVPISLQMGWI